MEKENIILGIDPGTSIMGYALIVENNKKLSLLALGVIDLHKVDDHYEKLGKIFHRVVGLIDEFKPVVLAIEAPFYGVNVQSMLKLGRAQGVAIAASLSRNLPVHEYAPRKIKMSITGNGAASKEQVAGMLQNLIVIDEIPKYLDATDALAVAICHYFQSKGPTGVDGAQKSTNSWKDFVSKNPNRIK